VAVFEALSCQLATNLLKSTKLEFTNYPAISYIRCYATAFFLIISFPNTFKINGLKISSGKIAGK
jgi:hypothetical protein